MLDTSTDLKSMLSDPSLLQTQAFINNQWVDGKNGTTFAVSNPARGDVIAQVADLSRADLARAIDGAEAAQKKCCLLYTSPSPRDGLLSRMPSSA